MTFTVTVFLKMMHLEILLIVCILLILLRQLCCSKKWVIRLCLFRDISRMPNLFKERCEVRLPYQIPSGCFFLFPAVYSQNITENEVYLTPERAAKPASVHFSLCCMWGLTSSSPKCPSIDMVSQNQAQLREIMHISSTKF